MPSAFVKLLHRIYQGGAVYTGPSAPGFSKAIIKAMQPYEQFSIASQQIRHDSSWSACAHMGRPVGPASFGEKKHGGEYK